MRDVVSLKTERELCAKTDRVIWIGVNNRQLKVNVAQHTLHAASRKLMMLFIHLQLPVEGLAKMRYEKPFDKLTFYKAFFSPQWKFMIHTILKCLSAKTTSWNEFSSTMAFAIICLAINHKFNFSRYILLSLVKNIEVGVPLFMFPRFVQLIINHQLGDMAHHKDIFDTPSLTKKVFANMKRVFSRLLQNQYPSPLDHQLPNLKRSTNQRGSILKNLRIKKLEGRVERLEEENKVLKELKSCHSIDDADEPVMEKEKSSKQGRKIADIEADVEINLEKAQEPADVEEVLEVVKSAKLMTKVVSTAGATKVSVPRKRRCVITQDPKETTTTATMQPKV
nr:hypothetical protein [Tanacetum cinerariifolium]